MDIITVKCTLSLNESGLDAITFTFEDIPFVIYSHDLYEDGVDDHELQELKVHVNDDHTICSVYDLKIFDRRRTGRFAAITTEKHESSYDRTERIKRELVNPDLKLSAPRNIFMKFIKDTNASLNRAELQRLYPEAFMQYISEGEIPESNPVSMIYEKKRMMFPSSHGGSKKRTMRKSYRRTKTRPRKTKTRPRKTKTRPRKTKTIAKFKF